MSDNPTLAQLLNPQELTKRFLEGGLINMGMPELGRMQDYGAGLGGYPAIAPPQGLPGLAGLPGLPRLGAAAAPTTADAGAANVPQVQDPAQQPGPQDVASGLGIQSPLPGEPGVPTIERKAIDGDQAGAAAGDQSFAGNLELPAGTILATKPAPPNLQPVIEKAAQDTGVPLTVANALFQTESSFNPNAMGPQTSTGRGMGLGQLMPETAKAYGAADPMDPAQNAEASLRYLKHLYQETGSWVEAMKRYGTFSTGRGPEADAAVEQKVSAQLGMPADRLDERYREIDPNGQPDPRSAGAGGGAPGAPGAGGAYGPYSGVISDAQRIAQQEQADTNRILTKWQAGIDADRAAAEKATAEVHPPTLQPFTQQLPNPTLAQQFGSWGSVFALLASGFSRRPMINAMNGLAGSINAMNKADLDEYNRQYDVWKSNTQIALDNYEIERKAMDDAVNKLSTDQNAALNDLKLNAAKYDSPWALIKLEDGAIEHVITAANSQTELAIKLHDQQVQMSIYHDLQTCRNDEECTAARKEADDWAISQGKKDPNAPKYQFIAGFGPDPNDPSKQQLGTWQLDTTKPPNDPGARTFLPNMVQTQKTTPGAVIDDDTAKSLAEQSLAGDPHALQGLGWGQMAQENRNKVLKFRTELMKERGMTGTDVAIADARFNFYTSGERGLGTRYANLETALNETRNFAQIVRDASAAVDRSKYKTINSMYIAYKEGTGDTAVVKYIEALNAFQNAYSQVINRGTGRTTDAARANAQEVLDRRWSDPQINAGVDQLMVEAEQASKAPKQAQHSLESGMGGKGDGDGGGGGDDTKPAMAAEGGLVINHVYTDKKGNKATYLGGPKNDPASWKTQ